MIDEDELLKMIGESRRIELLLLSSHSSTSTELYTKRRWRHLRDSTKAGESHCTSS